MTFVGRYRKLDPRIWRHPSFTTLRPSVRELALYLLTGPQTSAIGLFHFSVATAAEDLGVTVETIRKGLVDVGVAFGWRFDSSARVFFIPSWWHWNSFGLRCWELDALSPVVLRDRVEQVTVDRLHHAAWSRAATAEQAECELLDSTLQTWPGISGQGSKYPLETPRTEG